MNNNQITNLIHNTFNVAFARALERWTFELREQGKNLQYVIAAERNNFCFKHRLKIDWSKSKS